MNRNQSHASLWIGLAVFIAALALYIATLAPGLVIGDPAEYTFVPHIGGIALPPGYALYTVLAGIWQRMVPVGDIVYRTNLLSAFAGAGIAALVYGCVWAILPNEPRWQLPAVFAGLSTIAATDLWQHSIHANAHIITALLAVLSIFLLLSWRCHGGELDGWLWAFCLTAGLSVTHHPLLVFSFPAYTVFILTVRPGILFQPTWRVIFASPRAFLDPRQWMLIARNPKILAEWGTLARMVGFGLLGLLPWLYLPLVNLVGEPPIYGPGNTDTLNGFLDLVLARGLRVNLFAFGLAEQPLRLSAFWELLSLQIGWPFTVLMGGGLIALWAQHWRVGLLFTLMLAVNLLFILNTIQDVMAYLLVPFAALMILLGVGVGALLEAVEARIPQPVAVGLATLLLAIPAARTVMLAPRVSLAGFAETAAWIDEAYRLEEGYLLDHWEHLTPLWVESWVRDNPPAYLELVFVAANSPSPWLDNVQAVIDSGPV
ncbi:MAG: protein O-mannosyl-transferase family [Anaerolineae bacterium]